MTKIEWTDKTWNPVTGCTKISPGCKHCYAERMSKRLAGRFGYPEAPHSFDVTLHRDRLYEPLKWRKPRRVFVCSMSDLFHEDVPDGFIDSVFKIMLAALRPHVYQILTKRPLRMKQYVSDYWPYLGQCYSHIWIGVTAENQAMADERIPILLQTPAAVRFVSCEPLLGAIDLQNIALCDSTRSDFKSINALDRKVTIDGYDESMIQGSYSKLNLVIAGGETGPGARPLHPDWARSLRDQCQESGTPFFFKQWGEWKEIQYDKRGPGDIRLSPTRGIVDELPDWSTDEGRYEFKHIAAMSRIGKKAAGSLLYGREWREMPERTTQ